jgi:hypothetical protein
MVFDNFVEVAPIIYTPTVGWVCVVGRARGMR